MTGKRIVLILYEARIRAYSAVVSPLFSRETIRRQIISFWLCMGAPLNINYCRVPAESDSAKQHGSHEMIFTRDSVTSITMEIYHSGRIIIRTAPFISVVLWGWFFTIITSISVLNMAKQIIPFTMFHDEQS